jgi:amino acid adenylation domain-containing protein
MGIRKGDRVGIMLSKSIESIISLFGILKTGAIYVPIDPQLPNDRCIYIIKNCEIEYIISSFQIIEKLLNKSSEKNLPLTKVMLTGPPAENKLNSFGNIEYKEWDSIYNEDLTDYQDIEMTDIDPAYILHTSGSTGTPKGVIISHLNAMTFINMAAEYFNIRKSDVFANHAPLHFDLSVFDIFTAMKCGAKVVLFPEFLSLFPIKLAEYIEKQKITIWNSVSSVLSMIAAKGVLEKYRFENLRIVHFSGDIMPVKYLRLLKKYMKNAIFYNIYGQTEANSSMFYRIDNIPDNDSWKIPIGKSFPNFEVFALDKNGKIISNSNEEGELYVKSATVAMGYWNDEHKTKEKFVSDPHQSAIKFRIYKTGDLVRVDENYNYVFSGRKDHMIKSRGYRVELDEIELVLNSHTYVSQAVVIAIPDELIGNKIICYVNVKEDQNLDPDELINFCKTKLPNYMIPEIINFCDHFPKTPNGKIDRSALKINSMN